MDSYHLLLMVPKSSTDLDSLIERYLMSTNSTNFHFCNLKSNEKGPCRVTNVICYRGLDGNRHFSSLYISVAIVTA